MFKQNFLCTTACSQYWILCKNEQRLTVTKSELIFKYLIQFRNVAPKPTKMLIHPHVLLGEIMLSLKHYIQKRPEHPHRRRQATCNIDSRQIMMLKLWKRGFPTNATGSPFCQPCGMYTAHYVCPLLLFFSCLQLWECRIQTDYVHSTFSLEKKQEHCANKINTKDNYCWQGFLDCQQL